MADGVLRVRERRKSATQVWCVVGWREIVACCWLFCVLRVLRGGVLTVCILLVLLQPPGLAFGPGQADVLAPARK